MQLLADIWHVASRLVNALVFNPPSLPGWATWFTLIIRTIVVLVIFRRNIAPFLLAKITRRIRARSISIISIKGLYFHSAGRTWRVERIGWSFHPWAESRLSVKIEGLRLEISKPRTVVQRNRHPQPRTTARRSVAPLGYIREVLVSLEWLWEWLLMSSRFTWLRTAFSSSFILTAQLFIRCLPSLTQHLDFELDTVVVTFEALLGAQLTIHGITLGTKVEFSQMGKETEVPSSDSRQFGVGVRRATSHHWNSMLRGGADRFWERIWGQTEGFAAVHVSVRELLGHMPPTFPTLPSRQSPYKGNEWSHTSDGGFGLGPQLPSDLFLCVAEPRVLVSTQFSPKLLTLQRHSLDFSLDIAAIDASADRIQSLFDLTSADNSHEGETMTPEHTGPLSSPSTARVSSPSSSASPILDLPVSPTSPFINAFSQMARRRGSMSSPPPPVHRLKGPKVQPLVTAFKSIQVRLPSIRVSQRSSSNLSKPSRQTYLYTVDGVDFKLGLSNPSTNRLHREWLGSGSHSSLDGSIYALSWGIGLARIGRLPMMDALVHLLALHKVEIDLVAHHWPLALTTVPRFLPGDPNGSFVACDISVLRFYVTEQLEELRTSIDSAMLDKRTSPPKSIPTTLSNIPRIELRIGCSDIRASLTTRDTKSAHTNSMLALHTPGFCANFSTAFAVGCTKAVRGIFPNFHQGDVHMDTKCYAYSQPTFVRVGLARDCKDGAEYKWENTEDPDPFIRVDGVELSMTCNTLGHKDSHDGVILEPYTSVLDIRCITDDVSVEIWKRESIAAMLTFSDAVGSPGNVQQATPPSTILDGFRAGVAAHFAIRCLACVVTGSDINPHCGLELSRGLEFRTGISLRYNCRQSLGHSQHVRSRVSHDLDREQLGLAADLLILAMEVAHTESDPQDISAVLQCLSWQTICRKVTSTRYEYGTDHDAQGGKNEDRFLYIPRTVTKIRLCRRRQTSSQFDLSPEETCDVSMNISHIRSRLDLLNAYSALLASHTLKLFTLRHSRQSNIHGISKSFSTRVTFRLQVANAHIFCYLPLHERMFIRVLSASLEQSPNIVLKAECGSVTAWVTSPQVKGKWEELSRLYGANVAVTGRLPGAKVAVSAKGLRIAIPHGYVLSELILNINLVIKSFRHLYRVIPLGHYIPLESPGAEPPKQLLVTNIFIRSTTLEAADNPFESKLGLIWRTGFQAQKIRRERELAFEAKLRAIMASGDSEVHVDSSPQSDIHYRFTSTRSTSLADARTRLNMVHSTSWINSMARQKDEINKKENAILRQLRHATNTIGRHVPLPIAVHTPEKAPPLFRAVVNGLFVSLAPPNFPAGYEGFLGDLGSMPSSTEYSLLLPMHLKCGLDAAMMNIRDYPLPLLSVPFHVDGPSLEFDTDLVIAEEVGSTDSVEWFECPLVPHNAGIIGASAFVIQVPKTIMPVKSYAKPDIRFCTKSVTEFTWGVSYNPAIQEVMRVIETLSHPPQDPSPAIGFWDKLRLVFHWRISATFQGGAHFHFKGSRDPYHLSDVGAGFDFCWDGNVAINVGHDNDEQELIQLSSDTMLITIPDHETIDEGAAIRDLARTLERRSQPSSAQRLKSDRKICAKFSNGIRWGIGFSLERTCGSECKICSGDTFSRKCRFFTFVPHYEVVLRSTSGGNKKIEDSYAGFRSNFIHFSTSVTSPLRRGVETRHNSFHLTPKAFAHFWSWWHLFDSALSLPIRQGSLFPDSRPPSKKFGRHLATLKYRITFTSVYIAHVYKVDSGDAWAAGESHCVGVKALLEHFQADMHQREEETYLNQREGDEPKIIRHKPFSAVDVVITGIDLRALFAVFAEPQKKYIPLKESLPSVTRFWDDLDPIPLSSTWLDVDDFKEIDWLPSDKEPNLYLNETAHCPRFVYFKRTPRTASLQDGYGAGRSNTKFGEEETHMCLMGKEPSAHEVQLEFGEKRLVELRARLADTLRTHNSETTSDTASGDSSEKAFDRGSNATRETSITQMIALLERYTQHLSNLRASSADCGSYGQKTPDDIYDMPADIQLPQELGEFANVYQVHCPKINLNNTTRDILQKYYLASRARRGFEYHMSARAVKFIRDQAHTTRRLPRNPNPEKRRPRAGSAQAAAQAVRRMLTGDERQRDDKEIQRNEERTNKLTNADPLYGWDQGVSERKAHLCLLLKPQIVLRSERSTRSKLVLAADHVVLRNYVILDTFNAEDPVSGYIMHRNYANIDRLQVFQPVDDASADHLPLEVFLDFRCESRDFDRLVPQTNATLRYDKFNRLRLRNDATTLAVYTNDGEMDMVDHLQHEMDLIVIQVPRFQIAADATAFASIADVVTDLLLFSDPVHKARMTQLETMLFSYDFTDLPSAAKVVADLQSRIRRLVRIEGEFALKATDLSPTDQQDLLASKAHILTLSQELNLIFDAIRLAQDKADDRNQEKKSALHLRISSSEISWQMLDESRELLAKMAVQGIDYSWLSRQDSSTTSVLWAVDLQAFDGSPNALWPEILAKHDDPPTHRMIRRGLFAEAQWRVLAPVGGISIYDYFELELHPIRLALETQLGNKLVDYLIPGRRSRREAMGSDSATLAESSDHASHFTPDHGTEPFDNFLPQLAVYPPQENESTPTLTPRQETKRKARPIASRSFSNLRSAAAESRSKGYHAPGLPKSRSSTALVQRKDSMESNDVGKVSPMPNAGTSLSNVEGDASEMRHRSAQKTFVHVKIPSVHVLLSVMKGRGFLVRDARLRTHDLEWRNRTSSFEGLINQFIPSDPSLRGWVKVAWQQPVFSVGGVVKELITKTQWGRLGKSPGTTSTSADRRKTGGRQSDHEAMHPLPDPLEPSSTDNQPFSLQTVGSKARQGSEDAGVRQPPQQPTSRPRLTSLFRRAETRKAST